MDYRALGAPLAFEVSDDQVTQWLVGKDIATTTARLQFDFDRTEATFRNKIIDWAPRSILRAKNISTRLEPIQPDLFEHFDKDLIPELERNLMPKLDRTLRQVLQIAKRVHQESTGREPSPHGLFRLVFRLLAAKILHDRGHQEFRDLAADDVDRALSMVGAYYRETNTALRDKSTRRAVAQSLWSAVGFLNISVEVLAYIYEYTLVDDDSRKSHSIHSTPYAVARFMARRLPLDRFPEEERMVVEPCSGHGVFLVAALQRLRDSLADGKTDQERHDYFVRMLRGYEIDAFACEVSKLCLMLADFPNHNGWHLKNEDVFTSLDIAPSLRGAAAVLCNPPFRRFSEAERVEYGQLMSVYKPIELLYRVVSNLRVGGMIGFVLPYQFVDGQNYRGIRKLIAERFARVELVELPESNVFRTASPKPVLLLATDHQQGAGQIVVDFEEVSGRDLDAFFTRSVFTRQDSASKSIHEAEQSLAVTPLCRIWSQLADNPTLGDIAHVHRGIAWKVFDDDSCYSTIPRPGWPEGFARADVPDLQQFIPPSAMYLNTDPSNLRRGSKHPWEAPKVFVNAARVSASRCRHVAFLDEIGRFGSQRFHGIWPRSSAVNLETLASILNNPLAAAFVASHEKSRDITAETLKALPVPRVAPRDQRLFRMLVQEYVSAVGEPKYLDVPRTATDLLSQLHARLLRLYRLSRENEQEILGYLWGCKVLAPVASSESLLGAIQDELDKMSKAPSDEEQWQKEAWDQLQAAIDEDDKLSTRSARR
jgi:hypothetical protein